MRLPGLISARIRARAPQPDAYDDATAATIDAVRAFTMTSPERIAALCDAIRYMSRYEIPGAVVECGVWAGGSMMAAARTLLEVGDTQRELYLFDTFDGMTPPTEADRDISGATARSLLEAARATDEIWCRATLADVQRNMALTGYPPDRLHYVVGPVERTIPDAAPDHIAVLRLDTDWYESTRHELRHLAPRVAAGGVLIIDDYGHWTGAKKAVDEWIDDSDQPVLLTRIDYTGRLAVLGQRNRA